MNGSVRVQRDVSLRQLNTFHVPARARLLAEVADAAALPELLAHPDFAASRPLVLGGGSNLLFVSDPVQPLLMLTGTTVQVLPDVDGCAIVRAAAGVAWHDFVLATVDQGMGGLENLALIPGTVGAAPIQNIGAYGVEVCEFIHAVEAYEPAAGEWCRLSADACRFGYRDSLFKQQPDRFIVTAVEFALPRPHVPRLRYAGLLEALGRQGADGAPTPREIAEAVIAIRRSKLPDAAVIGNAGSFFKNPIVDRMTAEALGADHPALPVFPGPDPSTRKLSAAWLIDACGWKGHRDGDAGVAASHALVLVNHGTATGQQLLELARGISTSVRERFNVALEPEPRLVGATW
ncbi:UDP-N-acetylmuramate dehydrogenase [Novilysobacter spongiicola]|uniref:UDP-N-acetylenolpyruvoylglucosamine reductase n=1 Tax=Lysobacter spongiicola DSM 21749 TaxID=1122188 RepID=A0A1T4NTE3_9GAMM|nr:UDP-N-acetylmuramate dehydrogenase [Lysobacter spongiicola]SJZ82407.1 UDP-N-acetylmuramate dehydrogenase [Lysobacter spongiicola DSM 21749]